MSNQNDIKATLDVIRIVDNTQISDTYSILGPPCSRPVSILIISSTLNRTVLISTDGVNDMLLIPEGIIAINIGANKQGPAKFSIPAGTQFYIKEGPTGMEPAQGDFSLSCIFGG